MIEYLKSAGFLGVEAEGAVLHARLWASSYEFTATPEDGLWRLALQWPLRASESQMASWSAEHPATPMDIHLGETRISVLVAEGDEDALQNWATTAETGVAQMIRWRRAQRAPGEGY